MARLPLLLLSRKHLSIFIFPLLRWNWCLSHVRCLGKIYRCWIRYVKISREAFLLLVFCDLSEVAEAVAFVGVRGAYFGAGSHVVGGSGREGIISPFFWINSPRITLLRSILTRLQYLHRRLLCWIILLNNHPAISAWYRIEEGRRAALSLLEKEILRLL